jgi:LuxR family maltose regulon positive regulatory protein
LLAGALTHSLTLVSAPPGYGKTTLVASWLRSTHVPWTWLALEEADDDPVRFLQYLLASLQAVAPAIHTDLIGPIQGSQPLPDRGLMDLLINGLTDAGPFLLVLDDFQMLHDRLILDLLAYLLGHMPPSMHLALLTRVDPPLPLSQLRLRNELLEIRGEQLRFTPDEAGEFLNRAMGLDLTGGDIAAMEARTEGWIAGLQLAALSMRSASDAHALVTALSGTHAYIMDYLVEQVLSLQPEARRSFLLQTSILGRMCAELCSQVVDDGASDGPDGQAMLETLDRANLFLVPLDDERRWYRYHQLFADVLRRLLERRSPKRIPDLHRRASRWHEQAGFIQEAIQHALLAGDGDRAVQLIEQNGCGFLMRGEVVNLLRLIDAVDRYRESHVWLGVLKSLALTLTGRLEPAEQALQTAERLLPLPATTVEGRTVVGSISAARALRANQEGEPNLAAAQAQQALADLPEASAFSCSMRGVATSILGDASASVGDLQAAGRAYTDAARIGEQAGNTPTTVLATIQLAGVLLEQGHLHQAARAYGEALRLASRPEGQAWPLAEDAHTGLAILAYEWNHLAEAEGHVLECLRLCQQWGPSDMQVVAQAVMARIQQARGDPEDALEAARSAEVMAAERQLSPAWSVWLCSTLTRVWIAQQRLDKAEAALRDCRADSGDGILPVRLPETISLARLRLAQGAPAGAVELLGRLLPVAEAAGRSARVIEIHVLMALALQDQKEMEDSVAAVQAALKLAEGEGYVRVFLDEGPPMAKLLQKVRSIGTGSEYAAHLLSAARGATSQSPVPAAGLVEALTPRELEVLRLIEAGRSNQDIAARLVISPATLKRHITNLYAKLGVGSRTQALSAAKELKLID